MNDYNHSALSPLESDIIEKFYDLNRGHDFPSPENISVIRRNSSNAGRVTHLLHEGIVNIPDGQLDLGNYSQINMLGMPHGASFYVYIRNGKVDYLDIIVNGDFEWDGNENAWIICDPDTGLFPSS